MKNPKVSIIVRTKNEERWIYHCLENIILQCYKNHEIIVVDDNSTDQTKNIVKSFDVKLLNFVGEYYPARALNLGISEAKGDFLVFISGHCIPKNLHWLENLLAPFQKYKKGTSKL